MAISKRKRLTFTTTAVILMGTVSAFLLFSAFLPSTASTPVLAPGSVLVNIQNNTFPADAESDPDGRPPTITVPVGTTVVWSNLDRATHTVTSVQDLFDSGGLYPFSYTFTEPGVYSYGCFIHGMRGRVIVL